MNPLLMTGVLAVGQKLVNRVLGPEVAAPQASQPSAVPFARTLDAVQGPGQLSPLRQLFSAHGVRDAVDMEVLAEEARIDLLSHPDVQDFLAGIPSDASLRLEKADDGMYFLRSENGDSYSFAATSELGMTAGRFRETLGAAQLARNAPGAPVSRVISYMEQNPVGTGSWSLRS